MATVNDISPWRIGQRKPVWLFKWTRGDGSNPDLVTGSPTLSVKFESVPGGASRAGTGVFGGQTTVGDFTYTPSALDVASAFNGVVTFTTTDSGGLPEVGDPIPWNCT